MLFVYLIPASPTVALVHTNDYGNIPWVGTEPENRQLLWFVILVATAYPVAFVLLYLGRSALGPLKIAADIARFMGDRPYNRRLIRHLDGHLRNCIEQPVDCLVLVGHSLGSAILIQWLLTTVDVTFHAKHVIVITMGSPISRLLGRFFPSIFPMGDEASRCLTSLHPQCAWLNVYRPWDPIGSRLFGNTSEWRSDRSTGQFTKLWMSAHTGYWDDDVVHAICLDFVRAHLSSDRSAGAPPSTAVQVRGLDLYWEWPAAVARFHATFVSRVLSTTGALLILWLAGTLGWFLCKDMLIDNDGRRELGMVGDASGNAHEVRQVMGELYRYQDTISGRGDLPDVDQNKYAVVFTPEREKEARVVMLGAMENTWDMAVYVKGKTFEKTKVKRWQFLDDAEKCRVMVGYLVNDPTIIYVPGLSRLSPWSGRALFVTAANVLGTVMLLLMGTVGGGFAVLAALAGLLWWIHLYCGRGEKVMLVRVVERVARGMSIGAITHCIKWVFGTAPG
jgi:hypothetical protein